MQSSYWDKPQTEFVRVFNLVDGRMRIRKRTKKIDTSVQGLEGFLFIELNVTFYLQYVKSVRDWMSRC